MLFRGHPLERLLAGWLCLVTASSAFLLWRIQQRLPARHAPASAPEGAPDRPEVSDWSFLAFPNVWTEPGIGERLEELDAYSLAGTFQTFTGEDELAPDGTLALVDDKISGRQRLLREGAQLGSFEVESIGLHSLTLRYKDKTWELTLPGTPVRTEVGARETASAPDRPLTIDDLEALETTPFGKRVDENQWVIDRESVLAYAGEIMDSPLRAIQLYRSFDQVLDPEGRGDGFQISPRGENDFFLYMGLQEGDIIREANSLPLTEQSRAEYLVREFMRNHMSAVVLDVERDGERVQNVYLIR